MEPFSLLKYWRGSVSVSATHGESSSFISNNNGTTIVTADEESGDDDDDDEGPFFDMEFAVPCSEENREIEVDCDSDGENENENGKDFEFALSSGSSGSAGEQSDPSDDLFFKGRLVSIDTEVSEQNQKSLFLQKSANRLRILMLKLKKSKCNEGLKTDSAQVQNNNNNKESLIISLFTRDGSKSQKQIDRENSPVSDSTTSKDLMQKYLNKVKPMYVHVSRRYAEKLKLGSDKDGSSPAVSSETGNVKGQKQGNLQAGLKIVYKHLGKSRSATAAVPPAVAVTSRRCDDSLLDQQDGIQGAILHCKRSFNSSRDCSSLSTLARSVSDPTPPRKVPEKSL